MKIELAKNEIIHFVGIGGIGMSGLSLIMKGKGIEKCSCRRISW